MNAAFRTCVMPAVQPGRLAPFAQTAAARLKAAQQTVTIFEATTAGLIQAALQAVPGASAYTTCGAVTNGPKKAMPVLGSVDVTAPKPVDGAGYKEAKRTWTQMLARQKRNEVGATWCIAESGACGPTFTYPDISAGFTSIYVSGPVERGIFVESPHNDREENMWGFAKLALELLAECVEEAAAGAAAAAPLATDQPLVQAEEDRYGGVILKVPEGICGAAVARFDLELKEGLESWQAMGKKGLWLTIPLGSAPCVGPAAARGFQFHHAQSDYVLLTRWLPGTPSPLPKYGFTQIGIGGVVVNSRNEVLMVQERVSPLPMFQGSWKLPGGLADPGEDFVNTVQREVKEETGVTGSLIGVVSLRHQHGLRFNQGDIYVVVKLRAETEEIKMDRHELMGCEWMSRERLESLVVEQGQPLDGKISVNNWKVLQTALSGPLIEGTEVPNSRGGRPTMLYTAPRSAV